MRPLAEVILLIKILPDDLVGGIKKILNRP